MTLTAAAHSSDIVPNGATSTQVKVDGNGRAAITLAPTKSDVSYNAFSRFDVSSAGAQFQNADVKARTIVAEVFSPMPSRIEGPVSVDGPRANLILANQNGLRVNGGSFINFGSLAFTTGAVALRDEQVAPNVVQRYVDVTTRQGDIQIGSNGLDVNVIHLELIAKQVGISGNITNVYSSPTAVTRVVAGASVARFDTVASPTDNLTPWVRYTGANEQVSAIAIDVSARSTISSGRIEVLVTDQGAGVRNAGHWKATAGDFVLTSRGQIEQIGGEVQALGDIRIQAASLKQTSADGAASLIAADQSVRIGVDGDVDNEGGTIRGAFRNADDTDSTYAVKISAGGQLIHRTALGGPGAVIFGSGDNVDLFATGGITMQNARVVSNAGLTVQTEGVLRNESLVQAGVGRADSGGSSLLTSRSGYTVALGSLPDPDHQAYLVADTNLNIQARDIQNIGGHIFSNNGQATLNATRSLINQAVVVGSYGYSRSCFLFICRRQASSTEALIGGQIQAGNDLKLQAGQSILNDGGSVLAVGFQYVTAPEIIARGHVLHTVITRADGLKAILGDTWASLYAIDQGGSFTSQLGQLVLRGKARQERGAFAAAQGIDGTVDVIERPGRDPVTLDEHIGILSW